MATPLERYGWLSLGTAIVTVSLKMAAFAISGSVAVFSDAAEGLVNVAAGAALIVMLRWSSAPEDAQHPFGHGKGQHLTAAFEAILMLIACAATVYAAIERLVRPRPLDELNLGLGLIALTLFLNGFVGLKLIRDGKKLNLDAIEADGHHLLSDTVTTVVAIAGLFVVKATGLQWLDSALAIGITLWVLFVAIKLLRKAVGALVDESLSEEMILQIDQVLAEFRREGIEFHALRTRRSGERPFISMHVLVPGAWSVQRGHDMAERIEARVREKISHAHVFTHLEPREDPVSFEDQAIDR